MTANSDVATRQLPLLGIYLNDHLSGSTSGLELVRRMARAHVDTPAGPPLHQLADDIAEDRRTLLAIMRALRVPVRYYKVLGGWAVEKAARLKPNGRLRQRSPLSSVVELETLLLGIEGKRACWRVLRRQAQIDQRLDPAQLDDLTARAEQQMETVEGLRLEAAAEAFG